VIALGACYQTSSLQLRVRSPISPLSCVQIANQVFSDAGYVKVAATTGGMVYTPRGPIATAESLPMQWGVWVSIADQPNDPIAFGACSFMLQAVSADPTCGVQCPLTAQPGAEYDQITREMGRRLETFGLSPPAPVK
jgi:hypothetical protein